MPYNSKCDRWSQLCRGKAQKWTIEIRIPQHYADREGRWAKTDETKVRQLLETMQFLLECQGVMVRMRLQ